MDKGKITAAFATLLLTTTIIASLVPQATANPTTITTIIPNSGHVGTTVRVTGEIDTLNGSYQIRWDGESVRNGTCESGTKMVNDTFAVPLSAEGDHNVGLYDEANATESAPKVFKVTTSYSVLAEPARIVEGSNTTITVGVHGAKANTTYALTINVTDPQPTLKAYTTTLTISTDATGSGINSTLYYGNFSGSANTDYVGNYTIAVIADNETLKTGSFAVGLADKLEYRRTETVNIRGSGYGANETVLMKITDAGTPVNGYPKNITASMSGVVTHSWKIPINATTGIYTVTLTNATTPGTYKLPADAQNFTVTTATLMVTITDQPQTSYKWIETALIKFNVTYPDGTLYNTTHLGNITVAVHYNTTFVTNISLAGANYEPATGKWNCTWKIPRDATLGTGYNLTILRNAVLDKFENNGPPKNVSSTTFTVSEATFSCQIQAKNLAKEDVAGVTVRVYNATTDEFLSGETTNATGWARFLLSLGNYSFRAFWKDVEVGILPNQVIEENKTLTLECSLAHVKIAVEDEADMPLPFISVTLMYNYTTRLNETIPATESFETNYTGTVKLHNMFTNIDYTIEARRYGSLFNTTFIGKLPAQPWVNVTVVCPTYTVSVHVFDSERKAIPSVQVSLVEWGSLVLVDLGTTNDQGNVNLSATFGRYEVNVYNFSAVLKREVVLNETTFDLVEDEMSFEIHCWIFNVSLYVEALDYFGQPIRNALVEVERKFGLEWVKIENRTTGLDGFAQFVPLRGLVGGDCRVSVYVAGKLSGIKHLYLEGSKQILFKIDKYTMILGHPMETSQLIVYISIGLLVVVLGLALTYKRLLRRFVKKKEESQKRKNL